MHGQRSVERTSAGRRQGISGGREKIGASSILPVAVMTWLKGKTVRNRTWRALSLAEYARWAGT